MLKWSLIKVKFTFIIFVVIVIYLAKMTITSPIPIPQTLDEFENATRVERAAAGMKHFTGSRRYLRWSVRNHKYLQISPDGTVNTTVNETDYSILRREAIHNGQVKIEGIATCMFLCMDSCGLLYGSTNDTDECLFNETMAANEYNFYASVKHSNDKRTLYIGFKKGLPKKVQVKTGNPLGEHASFAKVLPVHISDNLRHLNHHNHQLDCPINNHTKLTESMKCKKRRKRRKRKKSQESEEKAEEEGKIDKKKGKNEIDKHKKHQGKRLKSQNNNLDLKKKTHNKGGGNNKKEENNKKQEEKRIDRSLEIEDEEVTTIEDQAYDEFLENNDKK